MTYTGLHLVPDEAHIHHPPLLIATHTSKNPIGIEPRPTLHFFIFDNLLHSDVHHNKEVTIYLYFRFIATLHFWAISAPIIAGFGLKSFCITFWYEEVRRKNITVVTASPTLQDYMLIILTTLGNIEASASAQDRL